MGTEVFSHKDLNKPGDFYFFCQDDIQKRYRLLPRVYWNLDSDQILEIHGKDIVKHLGGNFSLTIINTIRFNLYTQYRQLYSNWVRDMSAGPIKDTINFDSACRGIIPSIVMEKDYLTCYPLLAYFYKAPNDIYKATGDLSDMITTSVKKLLSKPVEKKIKDPDTGEMILVIDERRAKERIGLCRTLLKGFFDNIASLSVSNASSDNNANLELGTSHDGQQFMGDRKEDISAFLKDLDKQDLAFKDRERELKLIETKKE